MTSPEGDVEDTLPHLSPLKAHLHVLRNRVPYGINDFKTMVKDNNFIVDKTPWIAEALTGPRLKLITRPRRFGKTTNLSMLEAFLAKNETLEAMSLFAGFSIQNDTKFKKIRMEHQHKYAVLYFSFLSCCPVNRTALKFEKEFIEYLKTILDSYFDQYRQFFEPNDERNLANVIADDNASLGKVLRGYELLIRKLRRNGYKIAILIDEYDAPFQMAIVEDISATKPGKDIDIGEFYKGTVMRRFYLFFFKDGVRPRPDCGIMLGISHIPKTSIFSGLSDFMVYSTLNDNTFGPYFGFLDHEVKWLIDSVGINLSFEEFEEWYDGYHFGASVVFNPFAVVSAFHEGKFGDYWAESGSLEVIKHLIKYSGRYGILDLHFLLSGRLLRKEIYKYLQFADLMKTEESYWTLLTNAGYVDARLDMQSSDKYYSKYYSLRIPNKELKEYLTKNFKIELNETKQMYDSFVHSFNHLNNNASDFQKFLFDRFNTLSSYYKLHENAGLETLVNVFESLFIGFDFDHRSLGTLNMIETPVYQILFIKKDIAHVFNIAKMDAISSHINIDQLLNLPLTEENLSAIKNRTISKFFKTGIKITVEARKAIGHEKYSGAIKTIVSEGMQLIKDHLFPHTHG